MRKIYWLIFLIVTSPVVADNHDEPPTLLTIKNRIQAQADAQAQAEAQAQADAQAQAEAQAHAEAQAEAEAAAAAADLVWTLADLLRARGLITDDTVNFTQERYMRYLEEPLSSSGRLRYVYPDRLEMIVEDPAPESFVYQEGVLAIRAGSSNKIRKIPVEVHRVLSTLFTGLVAVLSGSDELLADEFTAGFSTQESNWTLVLIPRSKKNKSGVANITLTGIEGHISEVRLNQQNEEWSVLKISALE